LKSVINQTYKPIEIIIVDSFSTDKTPIIAQKYANTYSFGRDPSQKNIFAVPYQTNYGVKKSSGEYIYIVDSDMRLTPKLIESCVNLIEKNKADAIIIPEVSYGETFWAMCRRLEKTCYNSSDFSYSDSPRFIKKAVWNKLGGQDSTLGGSYDADMQIRLMENGYKILKTKQNVLHYEWKLGLYRQMMKKFIYGKTLLKYINKHKDKKLTVFKQYSLIKPDFIIHFKILIKDPLHALGMIFMKIMEYAAAFAGVIYELLKREKVRIAK